MVFNVTRRVTGAASMTALMILYLLPLYEVVTNTVLKKQAKIKQPAYCLNRFMSRIR